MLNLKKTAVAVIALSSSAVFAGTMGPVCSAVNVTVPCESTAWDIGAKALYLQPSISNGVGFENTITDNNTSTAQNFGVNPSWGWGFFVEGSYHFNTGNDVNLNWYHLNHSSNRTIAANPALSFVDPFVGTVTTSTGAASLNVDPHWDAVNLELGQLVSFGEAKTIRFHGGFEYARLSATGGTTASTTVSTTGLASTSTFSYSKTQNPSYNGFGPRVGADLGYDWGNGLSLYANSAVGLLAGSTKYSTTTSDSFGNNLTLNGSKTLVVPELEGKLGATYTYATSQGDLSLDAGWMWVNYFNAIQDNSLTTKADGDFAVQGPFIGLKFVGNVA